MSERVDDLEKSILALSAELSTLKQTCPLGPYRQEMKERCERLSEQISDNKSCLNGLRRTVDKEVHEVESRCVEKIKGNRMIVGRVISSIIILGIALSSVIGTIQIDKVGRAEFSQHIDNFRETRESAADRFEAFMTEYKMDRDRRDDKIDRLFQKQSDFNQFMITNNGLMQQQLEVIKSKLGIK